MLTMYVDTSKIKTGDKTYTRHLLRESYREGGKVRHRTVANLSSCSEDEIAAIRLALRHKKELSELIAGAFPAKTKGSDSGKRMEAMEVMEVRQGLSIGAVWLIHEISKQLGITDALGSGTEGKLALWQVIARVIDQGSRLSAVRLAGYHGACDILGLGRFDEDSLYKNLDWLSGNQAKIEDRLYRNLSSKPLFKNNSNIERSWPA